MMGLPYGEEIMIVGRTMWTQSTSVTDGRTDRQTDRITITKTVQRRASHGKKRKKWRFFWIFQKKTLKMYSQTMVTNKCILSIGVEEDFGGFAKKGWIPDLPD